VKWIYSMASARRTTVDWSKENGSPDDASPERSVSGTRARTSLPRSDDGDEAPLSVDRVGDAAVKLASKVYDRSAPTLVVPRSTLLAVALSPMEVFLASRCDGARTVGALALVSGLPQDEVLRTLETLAARGIVRF
jgi:hypothetical protein